MAQTRRTFLKITAALGASAWGARTLAAQGQMPLPTGQTDPFPRDTIGGPLPQRTISPAERMRMNQEQIKKNMTRLKEVVGELEKEFAANSTTMVLSMSAVRKTEEIERLARDIRGLIRG